MTDINQIDVPATGESVPDDTLTVGQKPKFDRRAISAPVNGLRGGRPKGTIKAIDTAKWSRLFMDGASREDIARALGVSVRTLHRRERERRRSESHAE